MSNRLYDALKYLAQVLLPAVGALYFGLAQVWGLPNGEEVVGTITVVDTFLGVLLKISSNQYDNSEAKYDGEIHVLDNEEGVKVITLDVSTNPDVIDQKNDILFKVNKNSGVAE
jgi:hypothetical protein